MINKQVLDILEIKVFNIDGVNCVSLKDFGCLTRHSPQSLYRFINQGNRHFEVLDIVRLDDKKFMIPIEQLHTYNFIDQKGRVYAYDEDAKKIIKSYDTEF